MLSKFLGWGFGILLVVVIVGASLFFYDLGSQNGVSDTAEFYLQQLSELSNWYPTHPPSPESVIVYLPRPPFVVHDTVHFSDTVFFKPDSLIVSRYPKAIWQINYNALNGSLIFTTYDGLKATEPNVGSFALEGDDKMDFWSAPWKPNVPTPGKTPFIYGSFWVSVGVTPDHTAFFNNTQHWYQYFSSANVKLEYDVNFGKKVVLAVNAGMAYDKWRQPYKFYPFVGVDARYKLMGKY